MWCIPSIMSGYTSIHRNCYSQSFRSHPSGLNSLLASNSCEILVLGRAMSLLYHDLVFFPSRCPRICFIEWPFHHTDSMDRCISLPKRRSPRFHCCSRNRDGVFGFTAAGRNNGKDDRSGCRSEHKGNIPKHNCCFTYSWIRTLYDHAYNTVTRSCLDTNVYFEIKS